MERGMREQRQLKWVTDHFNALTHHYFLAQNGICPKHAEDKTNFLLLAIQTQDETNKLERVTTAMLVEAALDAHQHIPLHNEGTKDEKKHQLTVLAGDFYSSLYYYRLAKMADIPLIRLFSESIQTMNNAKARLHAGDWATEDELEILMVEMEAALIINLAYFYEQRTIQDMASYYFSLKKMKTFMQWLEEGGQQPVSPIATGVVQVDRLKTNVRNVIAKQEGHLKQIMASNDCLSAPLLLDRVMTIIHA